MIWSGQVVELHKNKGMTAELTIVTDTSGLLNSITFIADLLLSVLEQNICRTSLVSRSDKYTRQVKPWPVTPQSPSLCIQRLATCQGSCNSVSHLLKIIAIFCVCSGMMIWNKVQSTATSISKYNYNIIQFYIDSFLPQGYYSTSQSWILFL